MKAIEPHKDSGRYERGYYRVEITDHGIANDESGCEGFWLAFVPRSPVRFNGQEGPRYPLASDRICRQFFDVDGGTFDDVHQSTPGEVRSGIRAICLNEDEYGHAHSSDPHGLVGRKLVAHCDPEEHWTLVPVKTPPEIQAAIDKFRNARRPAQRMKR